MDNSLGEYLLLALCFGASFLLSGMEAGVFALNRLRIRRLARTASPPPRFFNRFLEKPGAVSVDDSGGQHAGQFHHPGAGCWPNCTNGFWAPLTRRNGSCPCSPCWSFSSTPSLTCSPKCCSGRIPTRLCLIGGAGFPHHQFPPRPAGVAGRECVASDSALERRGGVQGPVVRQPGGNARRHASIRPGADRRRAHHGQPHPRSAELHGGPDCQSAGARGGGGGGHAAAHGDRALPAKRFFAPARLGAARTASAAWPACWTSDRCCIARRWSWTSRPRPT